MLLLEDATDIADLLEATRRTVSRERWSEEGAQDAVAAFADSFF
jgi:hypothetical protein